MLVGIFQSSTYNQRLPRNVVLEGDHLQYLLTYGIMRVHQSDTVA